MGNNAIAGRQKVKLGHHPLPSRVALTLPDCASKADSCLIIMMEAPAELSECPDSEVRFIVQHARLRTSESKDTSNLLI